MQHLLILALIALQVFVVAFIALHDWIQLGDLNDVRAVQAADPRARLVRVTIYSTLPFAIGLGACAVYANTGFPVWLNWYLYITYGFLAFGMVRAWWGPYLLWKEPARAARYQAMFGRTHAFLPERNGIRPNTLHVSLHLAVAAIIVLLIVRRAVFGA
jgi:hypothetical protein